MTALTSCAWCGAHFTRRATGGSAQRFCGRACRRAWDAEASRIGAEVLEAMRIDLGLSGSDYGGLGESFAIFGVGHRGRELSVTITFRPARALAGAANRESGDAG